MSEFFEKTFYNNTIAEWAISLLIIVGSIIIAKISYWVFSNILKRLTKKTKSELDDLIIDKIEEPVIFAIFLTGLWYGLNYLNLSEGFQNFVEKVFYVAITFDVAWFIVRMLDALIIEYLSPAVKKTKGDLDDQLLPIIRKSLKVVIWIIALVVGLNNAGYDVGALIAGFGLGGLAFAMAAKDSVANLFGGITIFMDKPFRIHDRIQIGGYDGTIEEIGIRSTRLKTLAGRTVTIPNKKFTDTFIENVTNEPTRKMKMTLGLTYDTTHEDVQRGIDILKDIGKRNDKIEENYVAIFESFGDFSINLLFIYYIKAGNDYFIVQNDINMSILQRFNEAKLEFAFPTQTIITQN